MFVEFPIRLRRRQPLIELIPLSFWIFPVLQQHKACHPVGELEHVLNLKSFFYPSGYAVDSLIAELGGDPAALPFEEIYKSRAELFVFLSCEHRISVESREQPKERLFAQIQGFHSGFHGRGSDKTLTNSPTTICGKPLVVRVDAAGYQESRRTSGGA